MKDQPIHNPYPEIPPKQKRKPRLTDEQVIAIHRSPAPPSHIAAEYGISRRTVYAIKSGQLRADLNLGMTKKYRELQTDRILGLKRKRYEESITGIEVLDEEADPLWLKIKAEAAAAREKKNAADTTPR